MGCFPSRLRPLELAHALKMASSLEKGSSNVGYPSLSSTSKQVDQAKLEPHLPCKPVLPKSLPSDRDFSDNTPHSSGRKNVPHRRSARFTSSSTLTTLDPATSTPVLPPPPRRHQREASQQWRHIKRTNSAPEGVSDRGGSTSPRNTFLRQSPDQAYNDGERNLRRRSNGGFTSSQVLPSLQPREVKKTSMVTFATQQGGRRREAQRKNIRRAWQTELESPGEDKHFNPPSLPPPRHARSLALRSPPVEAKQSALGEIPTVHSEMLTIQEVNAKSAAAEKEKGKQKGVVFTQVQMPTCTLNFTTVQDSSIDLAKAQDIFKMTDKNNHRRCAKYSDRDYMRSPVTYPPNCTCAHYPVNVSSSSQLVHYALPEPPRHRSPRHHRYTREKCTKTCDERRSANRASPVRPRVPMRDTYNAGYSKRRTRSPRCVDPEWCTSSASYHRLAPGSRKSCFRDFDERSRRKRKEMYDEVYSSISEESISDRGKYRSNYFIRRDEVKPSIPSSPRRCRERHTRKSRYRSCSPQRKTTMERFSGRGAARRTRCYERCGCPDEGIWSSPRDWGDEREVYQRHRPVSAGDRSWNRREWMAFSDKEEPETEDDLSSYLSHRQITCNRSCSYPRLRKKHISWQKPLRKNPFCGSQYQVLLRTRNRYASPCRSPTPYNTPKMYVADANCSSSCRCRHCGQERRRPQKRDCIYTSYDSSENTQSDDHDPLILSGPLMVRVMSNQRRGRRLTDEIPLRQWRRNKVNQPHHLKWALEPLNPRRRNARYRQSPRQGASDGGCWRSLGSHRKR